MKQRGKPAQKQLTDEEVLEWFVRSIRYAQFTLRKYHPLQEVRKDLQRRMLVGACLAGPFVALLDLLTWFRLLPIWHITIPLGMNAFVIIFLALSVHLSLKHLERFPLSDQEQRTHLVDTWFFLFLGWLAFYTSLMALWSAIGSGVRIPGAPWWVLPIAYGIGGVGLWIKRRTILRAIVEGPETHPWFWPIRIFFATSLSLCILITAVSRIFFNWLEQINVGLALVSFSTLLLVLSLLFLGLAVIAKSIAYLHYQKWKGKKTLRI